jgi:hypothetical protein
MTLAAAARNGCRKYWVHRRTVGTPPVDANVPGISPQHSLELLSGHTLASPLLPLLLSAGDVLGADAPVEAAAARYLSAASGSTQSPTVVHHRTSDDHTQLPPFQRPEHDGIPLLAALAR